MKKHHLPNRVLVTGATGFIGRHLVSHLEQAGVTVCPFSASAGNDICSAASFETYSDCRITHVIHLAGRTFVPDSWVDPGQFYETNVLGTQRLLDFCRKQDAKLVYVSAYVYGIPQVLPISELHHVAPNNPYAHSKWLGEELCRFYAEQFGLSVTVLRPFNLFGSGQSTQFLIPSILQQARTSSVISIKDSSPRRDYLHVDDFVRACSGVLSDNSLFSLYNVGFGASYSVAELLDMVLKYSKKTISWEETGESRINEIPETVADISAITAAFGWKPEITPEEFIRMELV